MFVLLGVRYSKMLHGSQLHSPLVWLGMTWQAFLSMEETASWLVILYKIYFPLDHFFPSKSQTLLPVDYFSYSLMSLSLTWHYIYLIFPIIWWIVRLTDLLIWSGKWCFWKPVSFCDKNILPTNTENMRKPDFCIWEKKGADQLRGYRAADQRLCFRYMDSTILLLSNCEISSL